MTIYSIIKTIFLICSLSLFAVCARASAEEKSEIFKVSDAGNYIKYVVKNHGGVKGQTVAVRKEIIKYVHAKRWHGNGPLPINVYRIEIGIEASGDAPKYLEVLIEEKRDADLFVDTLIQLVSDNSAQIKPNSK